VLKETNQQHLMHRYFLLALVAILFLLFGFTKLKAQQPEKDVVNTVTLIDSLSNALFKNYIFPEKSNAIVRYLKERVKQHAYKNIKVPSELSAKLQQDINSIHRDPHLRVYYEPRFEADLRKPRGAPVVDTTEIDRQRADNFSFKHIEILGGNIGYVEFTGFSNFIKEAKPTLDAAFRFLSNTEAVIIDLRKNGGGSPWMVKQIGSYFVKTKMRMNDIYERRSDKTVQFWADPAEADSMNLTMPLYILTSKETFSAAEDFTYAMQVAKRATVIGDTTGGGAHPTGPVPLGQGFVADIPLARSINYLTQTDWEGVGVLPDYPCKRDDALIKAQEVIFGEKMKTAKSDGEKDRIAWFLNSLHVHEYDQSIDSTRLASYEGDYDRFSVYVENNKLYVDDLNGKGRKFLLKPITPTLYLGSDWFQVEFLLTNGKVTRMKMLGKPGWVNLHEKRANN
jgi:hypothetical protein